MAIAMRMRRNIIEDPAIPKEKGSGLKCVLTKLTEKPQLINHNAAKDSLTEDKSRNHFNTFPHRDETLEEKKEREEQNLAENVENLRKTDTKEGIQRQFTTNQNLNDLDIKLDNKTKELVLNEAMHNPRSKNPKDPMGLVEKTKEKIEGIINIIVAQKLSAERIQALLEKNLKHLVVDGLGKLKNKHSDYQEALLRNKMRRNPTIQNNIENQKVYEGERPNLFTTGKSEKLKTEISDFSAVKAKQAKIEQIKRANLGDR